MRTVLIVMLVLLVTLAGTPAAEAAGTLNVDVDGVCGGNLPCYYHPQDAVNDANPGDTIRVYPGTYGSRVYTTIPPHSGNNNQYAPALIVYKDGLTIRAVDNNPANTIIQTNHRFWSNPVAIQASTGGVWDNDLGQYVGAGVNPSFGTAPNAISIIANNVTIDGFTVRRSFDPNAGGHNTILIGGLYAGYGLYPGEVIGYHGNTIKKCVMDGGALRARNGVSVWHSTNNLITNNTIIDPRSAAINIYDGYSDAEVGLIPSSQGNRVIGNTVIDNPLTTGALQGVVVGAWNMLGPIPLWTDNAVTRVTANDLGGLNVLTSYSSGEKRFTGNRNVGSYQVIEATDYFFPPNVNSTVAGHEMEMLTREMEALQEGPPADFDTTPFLN